MYEQHFGFDDKPFRVVPSPRFLYASDTHDESRARILYGIRESRGFVVVTGAVGLGKTTVLLCVLEELDDRVRTALVFNPVETFAQLLRLVCLEFGIETEQKDEVALLWELNLFLVDALSQHRTCVLLIDEAQNLSIEMLEKVRTLSNLQTETASLLQVVLVGQPELRTKLDDPRLVQLRQRVGVWHEIAPLGGGDAQAYIWHRLRLAGHRAPERLFPATVCARIHHWSAGVPRLINQLCDTALVIAFGAQENTISVARVDEAADELRLVDEHFAEPEVRGPGSLPTHATAPGRSTPDRSRAPRPFSPLRWVLVALVVLALGWLGGQLAGLWGGPLLQWGPTTGGASPGGDTELAAGSLAIADAGSTSTVAADSAGASDATTRRMRTLDNQELAQAGERFAAVGRSREAGRVVFCAHLASFRTRDHALGFARDLLGTDTGWSDPLFLEETQSGWFRVMGGGFSSREDARRWIATLKRDRGVAYAQLDRLDYRARPLVLETAAR